MAFALLFVGLVLVLTLEVRIMGMVDDLKATLARINEATNNIAADIRRLAERQQGPLTEAEAQEIKAEFEALAVRLEAVAAETPEA